MDGAADTTLRAARRFRASVLAVAVAEAALALLALSTGLTPYLLACAAATSALAIGGHHLMTPRDEDDGDEGGEGPDGGPPPDDPPPPWWPEFEAAFRRHAAEREHAGLHRPAAG